MTKTTLLAAALGLTLLVPGGAAAAEADQVSRTAMDTITHVCQDCHGPRGDSLSPSFPRLNGQRAEYILAQIKSFKNHDRSDPHARAYMWGMASQLSDAVAADIAKYYSSQTPTPPQSGGVLAAKGHEIFDNGAPDQEIPACKACHGDNGEGAGEIPRIAGQHGDYLRHQLEDFRSLVRDNDIMHANTKEMTDSQIEAIVSYLSND